MCQLLSFLLMRVVGIVTMTQTATESWNVTRTQVQCPGAPELRLMAKNIATIQQLPVQHQHPVLVQLGVSQMETLGVPNACGSIVQAVPYAPLLLPQHQRLFALVGVLVMRVLGLPNAVGSIALAAPIALKLLSMTLEAVELKRVPSVKVIATMTTTVPISFDALNVMAAIQYLLVALEQTLSVLTIAMTLLRTAIVFLLPSSAMWLMMATLLRNIPSLSVAATVIATRIVNLG